MKPFYYSLLCVLLLFSIGCGNANSQKEDTVPLSLKIASYNVHNAIGMDDIVDFEIGRASCRERV